jgi:drug/metabolite transporter (DMT)-like permease
MFLQKSKYHISILLAAFSYSGLSVISTLLTNQHVDAFTQIVFRSFFSAIMLFMVIFIYKVNLTLTKSHLLYIAINSFLFTGAFTTYSIAIYLGTPIAKASALNNAYPFTTIILSYILFHEIPSKKNWIAVILSLCSVLILLEVWHIRHVEQFHIGDIFAIANSVFFGGMVVFGRKIRTETHLNSFQSLFYTLLFTIPLLFLLGFLLRIPFFTPSIRLNLPIISWFTLVLAAFATIVPLILLYISISKINATVASVLLITDLVWIYIFGLVLFHQPVTIWGALGIIGIMASILLV